MYKPSTRAAELPDEFIVKDNLLHCKWCDKALHSLRKDNIREHLYSRSHQQNRREQGAAMSLNPDSPTRRRRIAMRRKKQIQNRRRLSGKSNSEGEIRDDQNDRSQESDDALEQIFAQSDSDESGSFEGFNDSFSSGAMSPADDYLSSPHSSIDSSRSSACFIKNSSESQSISMKKIPIRSMPLKKQLSSSARQSTSPRNGGPNHRAPLKIKIKRPPQANMNSSSEIDMSHEQRKSTFQEQKRRQWTNQDNLDVMECYAQSTPSERGYRKRMLALWMEKHPGDTICEQRLADQKRIIVKNQLVTPRRMAQIMARYGANAEMLGTSTSENTSDTDRDHPEHDQDGDDEKDNSRTSLKMKFILKKSSTEGKKSRKRKRSHDEMSWQQEEIQHPEEMVYGEESDSNQSGTLLIDHVDDVDDKLMDDEPVLVDDDDDDDVPNMLGLPAGDEYETLNSVDGEVVEEEIVGVDDGEVVSWDAVMGGEGDENQLYEEEICPASPSPPLEPELTMEENLAQKVSHAREMAKSVRSAQFKKKRRKRIADVKIDEKYETPRQKHANTLMQKVSSSQKEKRKATGYMLWSSKMRRQVATKFPGLQFGDVSKKLGDLWKKIPDKEKQMWKYRSVKMASEMEKRNSASTKRKLGSRMIETGPKKKPTNDASSASHFNNTSHNRATSLLSTFGNFPPHKNPEVAMQRELHKLPAPAIEPIDCAAYLHLLGESLSRIGHKLSTSLKEDSASHNVVPLMLDSFVCSVAPLLTLTNQVPAICNAVPEQVLSGTLANIAHYIPGL